MELSNVLFIDTESDPVTKQPECLQWLLGDNHGIIEDFTSTSYELVKKMWGECEAVLFFNAPYL